MNTPDPDARDVARTIRRLGVATLDELRHMVTVLRASGGRATELAPQPTLANLRRLVGDSGIDAHLDGDLPPDLPAPVQRAETLHGAFRAAPAPDGGCTVSLRIPVPDTRA